MIEIEDTLVSEDLFDKYFACDLKACKGACCVLGDAGAPLVEQELNILEEIFEEIKPYMRVEGIEAVERQGAWEMDKDGEYVTPLVEGTECAYVQFTEDGTALCAIDQAYRDGKVSWQKPISCHLYPIRLTQLKDYIALNYHKWHICSPACDCGAKLKIPIYQFAKDALIRAFGQEWFDKLQEAHKLWQEYRK